MTVKELKEKLNEFPDNMEIGGSGHFGEILELRGLFIEDMTGEKYVRMDIEWEGSDPESHWD